MTKMTDARRKTVAKYRKEKTHTLIMYYPNRDYDKIDAYCKFKQTPVATWVRKLIWDAIDSDETFKYKPKEEGNTQ